MNNLYSMHFSKTLQSKDSIQLMLYCYFVLYFHFKQDCHDYVHMARRDGGIYESSP